MADFQREYGLDLTGEDYEMSWQRFQWLLWGLSPESRFMGAVRQVVTPQRMTGDEEARFLQSLRDNSEGAEDA